MLTRATFAGGQRYAAVWPGDNASTWDHLRASLPVLMGMGLSGLSFVGSDIGGFAETPTAELVTRWMQVGVFYPFMRMHTEIGSPDQEPWSYGNRHEAVNRRAIELRYELLPHVYNAMHDASETGVPPLRPLMLEYPTDPKALGDPGPVPVRRRPAGGPGAPGGGHGARGLPAGGRLVRLLDGPARRRRAIRSAFR